MVDAFVFPTQGGRESADQPKLPDKTRFVDAVRGSVKVSTPPRGSDRVSQEYELVPVFQKSPSGSKMEDYDPAGFVWMV